MTNREIARLRLKHQRLVGPSFEKPDEAVRRLGAVQAQDYSGAKWALGLRVPGVTDREVEQAFADGLILRTHIMRPTWHFVAPADIRWMQALTAPRVQTFNKHTYRKCELDGALLTRCNAVLKRALRGGKQRTRDELRGDLERAGIVTGDTLRMSCIMINAELEALVCSGARQGKQFTYALLDERVPPVKPIPRDEALAELARRYFSTRGPASAKDFAWWSGLSMVDVRKGVDSLGTEFEQETINGQPCWFIPAAAEGKLPVSAHLLPNYDESFIALKDRSAMMAAVSHVEDREKIIAFFAHIVVVGGQAVGGWKRIQGKNETVVELNLLTSLTKTETRAVEAAARRYGEFLEMEVGVTWSPQSRS
jgi:hypothetical protein